MSAIDPGIDVKSSIERMAPSFTLEKPEDARARGTGLLGALRSLDYLMVLTLLALTAFGIWVLFGTVQGTSVVEDWKVLTPHKQITWFGIALCALALVLAVDYHWLGKIALIAYFGNIALLVLVLLFGTTVNGSTSWFRLGPVNFQPSETMKVAAVMMLAQWFALRPEGVRGPRDLVVPGIIVAVPMALILKQNDLGTAVLFVLIFGGIVFWAGIRRWLLVGLILSGIVCCAAVYPTLSTYRKERILTFIDPMRDPTNRGYNAIQSMIAVGSGGVTGEGWGEGTQAVHRWLPEAHTDFIFASAIEQTGLLGAGMLLGLYGVLFWRILRTIRLARDRFGGLMVVGLGAILFGHIFINTAMNVGLFPITGLPLPFMSYGGSFLLATYVIMGLILNVSMRRYVFNAG